MVPPRPLPDGTADRAQEDRALGCFNDEMDSSRDSNGIYVPESPCAPDAPGEKESEMQSTTIAVDLAKSVFEVAVSRRPCQVAERHRLSRGQFSRFLAERAPATIVMEACGTAHYLGPRGRGPRSSRPAPAAARGAALRPAQQDRRGRTPRGCSKPCATRASGPCRSSPWTSTFSRVSTACARPGWPPAPRGSTPCGGRSIGSAREVTTRQPSHSPTSSRASSGPSGGASRPLAFPEREAQHDPPTTRLLRAHDGDGAPVLTGTGECR